MGSLPTEKTNGAVQQSSKEGVETIDATKKSDLGAVQQKSSKEGVETIDATKRSDLRKMNQKHLTPKNEEHKEEIKLKDENHKEDVGSLPTEKTNGAVQQKSSKEGVETIEATKKSDLRKIDQKHLAPKNEEHKKERKLKS